DQLLLQKPNIPHQTVPMGKDENDNEIFKTWREPNEDNFKPHWELAEARGWIDFERGANFTGAGCTFYKWPVAKLQRAMITYFLDTAIYHGFAELQPPCFVNESSARGTAQRADKEDMMYEIPRDSFFNTPTAEVPVTNFHRDEIFEHDQ